MRLHCMVVRIGRRVVMVLAMILCTATNALQSGDAAPDFTLPVLANPEAADRLQPATRERAFALITLSEYRGQTVLLDFWQSSCTTCRLTLPELTALQQQMAGRPVQIISVNTDPAPRDALNFLARYPTTVPVASDPAGLTARKFGIDGLPTAILINPEGTVTTVARGVSGGHLDTLRTALMALSFDANKAK